MLITVVVDVGDAAETLAAGVDVVTGLAEGMTEAVILAVTDDVADAVLDAGNEKDALPD